MQMPIAFESIRKKKGEEEEVLAENLEVQKFPYENFSPPVSSQRENQIAKLTGDSDPLKIEKIEEDFVNEISDDKFSKETRKRTSKKFHTRVSFLKSKFSIENHRLVEQIESANIFVLYSEQKREIINVFFRNTILPHLLSNIFFLIFHFVMDYIKLSCFMPEKKCPCPSDDYLKKLIFSFREIFIQGNFFIFPYYLIFSVRSGKYGNLQKLLYFSLIPSTFALFYLANGEADYPVFSKNIILGGSFCFHMMINFLRKFKGRMHEMWNYFKLTIVLGFMSVGAYYFTNFQLRFIKEYTFQFRYGDLYFTVLIWIISRFNSFIMNFIVNGYEKLLESEKLNYNPLLYFIKFFLTIQYGFKLASIGQLKTLSLAFILSLLSLIFSFLRFHFGFNPFTELFQKIFRRKKHKKRGSIFNIKDALFVQKITSFQRLDIIFLYGSRLIYIYFAKRLIKQHSKDTAAILDCTYNLNSEPNFLNLFAFLVFDFILSALIIIYIKIKKLNHLKYIVDDHNMFVKFLISISLAIHLEYYMFHLVSIDPGT